MLLLPVRFICFLRLNSWKKLIITERAKNVFEKKKGSIQLYIYLEISVQYVLFNIVEIYGWKNKVCSWRMVSVSYQILREFFFFYINIYREGIFFFLNRKKNFFLLFIYFFYSKDTRTNPYSISYISNKQLFCGVLISQREIEKDINKPIGILIKQRLLSGYWLCTACIRAIYRIGKREIP